MIYFVFDTALESCGTEKNKFSLKK